MNKRDTDEIKKIGPSVERLWPDQIIFCLADTKNHKLKTQILKPQKVGQCLFD